MDEQSNPIEVPASAKARPGRWQRPVLIGLLLLAAPIVLGVHFRLGMTAALITALALNFAIRGLKRSQFEHGRPIDVRPYFVLVMIEFVVLLYWWRFGPR